MVTVVKRLFLMLLILTLCAAPAMAAFSSVFTPIDNEVLPNETATFDLSMSNFNPTQSRFQVYTIDPNWVMRVSPLPVNVGAGSSADFIISLKPKSSVSFGSQGVVINIKDLESGDLVRHKVFVALKSFDSVSGEFRPGISYSLNFPTEQDPRDPVDVVVHLRNRNALDIDAMTMIIDSPHFHKEEQLALGPIEEKTLTYRYHLDPHEPAGEYTMAGKLVYRGERISETKVDYTVLEYSNVNKDFDRKSVLFRTTKRLTLTNEGNVPSSASASISANFFTRIFSSTNPTASYESTKDGHAYVWDITLDPGASMTVELVQNYRWLVGAIILIILLVIGYFIYRSPVVSLKEVVGVKHGEGVSDIKIRIFIKNRSNKIIQGVEVLDKIPSIAELSKAHALGTIKPTKISRLKSGTLLRWNLDVLEPYEERILTYSVQSKLKIIGKLSLPQSKMKFETTKGKERVIYSNNIQFVEKK